MTTVNVKMIPFTARESFDPSLVTPVAVTTVERAAAPYPPGNVKINGDSWPTAVTGDAVMTWAHRNRKGPFIVPQDAASYSAGQEGDYTIEIEVDSVLVHSVTGVTADTYTYTAVQRALDDANPAHLVVMRIIPTNGLLIGTARELGPFLMS